MIGGCLKLPAAFLLQADSFAPSPARAIRDCGRIGMSHGKACSLGAARGDSIPRALFCALGYSGAITRAGHPFGRLSAHLSLAKNAPLHVGNDSPRHQDKHGLRRRRKQGRRRFRCARFRRRREGNTTKEGKKTLPPAGSILKMTAN